jgi:hypothetical protein
MIFWKPTKLKKILLVYIILQQCNMHDMIFWEFGVVTCFIIQQFLTTRFSNFIHVTFFLKQDLACDDMCPYFEMTIICH